MQFILIAHDKAGAASLRAANRPAHLAYLEQELGPKLLFGGPLQDPDGNSNGSVLVVEAADEAEARRYFDADPFILAELFADVTITRFRHVISNGVRV
jgi:uncharacterized protein YciI